MAKSRKKKSKRKGKKKGHIPISILKARHARLGRIIANRT